MISKVWCDNMSSQVERLPFTYLLIFHCLTFFCVYGRGQDWFSSCEVEVMVRRGTTWRVVPQQRLTVPCPVKHCGELLNVTWCKEMDTGCAWINHTENVEIRQNENHGKDELISSLTFNRISIDDDGLYHCYIKGFEFEQNSHIINISVSDLNQGIENSDNNAGFAELSSDAGDGDGDGEASWLPYFLICAGIALLVAVSTVLSYLRVHGFRRTVTFNNTKGQEMSNHMIPELPKGSPPLTLFLPTHCSGKNDHHSPSTTNIPTSQPSLAANGNQPADENNASEHAAYAVIKHCLSGIPESNS